MIDYLHRIQAHFNEQMRDPSARLFTTNLTRSGDLWATYLASFPEGSVRQYHNCSCCRSFIERIGSLVTINDDGQAGSPIWSVKDAPSEYAEAVARMSSMTNGAAVTGVFQSAAVVLGTPEAGGWEHFSVKLPDSLVHTNRIRTAGQRRAELAEEFGMVQRALSEFSEDTARQALGLLEAGDALYRSEKVLGVAKWFADIHAVRKNRNRVWRAVATAPAGFAHVRSSMIGTLLEDIQAGMGYDAVSKRFAAKMHPLQYQRPTAAPKAGSIAVAEKRMVELGLTEAALERRLARADEVPVLWRPVAQAAAAPAAGMFGHLAAAAPARNLLGDVPPMHMTVEKFVQTVVGTARKIEALVPASFSPIYITTAVQDTGVKLFHWNHLFAWYVYHGGRSASSVSLQPGFVEVTGVTTLPASWDNGGPHHGEGVILLLAGARETRQGSLALFPECMRGELREVRSVIEAYSNSKLMQGIDQPNQAIGIDLRKGSMKPVTLRVDGRQYLLDRWE